ncbi:MULTISPECIES: hypothetical protein [Acinetobacter]|uniref:hypothetical protein n=1 Tax=Acinetobacter TaxID=469 RepID=UPI001E306B98|nr:hypothetical protein [Acinetobacter sp. MYb10]
MKAIKMLKTLYIFILLCLSVECFAKPVKDSDVLLNQAIKDLHSLSTQGGIMGVIDSVDRCYKNPKKPKLYCFYLDYSGRIFDAFMVESINAHSDSNYPTNAFFSDENFQKRIFINLYKPYDSSMEEANSHMNFLYYKILDKLNEAFIEN